MTLRVKTEYVIEQNDRGKSVPRKVGLKPVQRDGIEYEFDVVGEMDLDNVLTVTKSRIPTLSGVVVQHPGSELAETVRDWLADGEDAPGPREYQEQAELCDGVDELKALWHKVKRLGIGGAPLQDAEGTAVTLLQYIEQRAHSIGAPA